MTSSFHLWKTKGTKRVTVPAQFVEEVRASRPEDITQLLNDVQVLLQRDTPDTEITQRIVDAGWTKAFTLWIGPEVSRHGSAVSLVALRPWELGKRMEKRAYLALVTIEFLLLALGLSILLPRTSESSQIVFLAIITVCSLGIMLVPGFLIWRSKRLGHLLAACALFFFPMTPAIKHSFSPDSLGLLLQGSQIAAFLYFGHRFLQMDKQPQHLGSADSVPPSQTRRTRLRLQDWH